jgi:hypothetical protein
MQFPIFAPLFPLAAVISSLFARQAFRNFVDCMGKLGPGSHPFGACGGGIAIAIFGSDL